MVPGANAGASTMAKYLVKANYAAEGIRGLIKEGGSSRATAVRKMVEGVGGSMDLFYYAYGDTDAYVVVDVPSEDAALSLSLAVNACGAVTLSMVPLISPAQFDAAAKRAVSYAAPA